MKIKIFESHDREKLEEKVNDFLQTVKVVDMQFKIRPAPNDQFTKYILLISYEE